MLVLLNMFNLLLIRSINPWQLPCCLQRLHTSSNSSNPWIQDDAAADTTAAAAAEAAAAGVPHLGIFSAGAAALDALHAATGMPWWAVIPATSVGIKTLLLPLSLKQAKIVRTNMVLWTESFEFLRQREARDKHRAAADAGVSADPASSSSTLATDLQPREQQFTGAAAGVQQAAQPQQQRQQQQQLQQQQLQAVDSATAALQQLQHWQARLAMYHELRVKCGVPHPAWFMFNQLLQVRERYVKHLIIK
jgi:membrane protein insertase Oxa1/YidC/SpoIIIJ